ncbi:DNA cytosine methyltransferase, partial [Klebsiella pneumoniae]|nr:DNA cytosine methyltransferase [Klebsiella pneumoniae]
VEMLRVFIRNGAIVISDHNQQERVIERVNRLISKLENGESLSVCSLFHGGGVLFFFFMLGFQKCGIASWICVGCLLLGKF